MGLFPTPAMTKVSAFGSKLENSPGKAGVPGGYISQRRPISTVSLLLTCQLSPAYQKKCQAGKVGKTRLKSGPLPEAGRSSSRLPMVLAQPVEASAGLPVWAVAKLNRPRGL